MEEGLDAVVLIPKEPEPEPVEVGARREPLFPTFIPLVALSSLRKYCI
jgi:hypothetical protein